MGSWTGELLDRRNLRKSVSVPSHPDKKSEEGRKTMRSAGKLQLVLNARLAEPWSELVTMDATMLAGVVEDWDLLDSASSAVKVAAVVGGALWFVQVLGVVSWSGW